MQLDLTALHAGIEEEFVKTSAPLNTSVYNGARAIVRPGVAAAAPAAAKSLLPAVAGTAAKNVAKYAPGIGGLVHGGFAINDLLHGDWTGAAMNAGAGLAAGFGATPIAVGLDVANAGRQAVKGLGNMATSAMNTVGKYAPAAMAGMAALSGGGNKTPQQMGYNPYRGPRPQNILNTTTMDPHSLAAPQMFAEKLAAYFQKKAGIGDAIANAASRKMLDSVFDTAAQSVDRVAQQAKEKEVELTSKYPEIENMLKDQQNKAYLEKLLKE